MPTELLKRLTITHCLNSFCVVAQEKKVVRIHNDQKIYFIPLEISTLAHELELQHCTAHPTAFAGNEIHKLSRVLTYRIQNNKYIAPELGDFKICACGTTINKQSNCPCKQTFKFKNISQTAGPRRPLAVPSLMQLYGLPPRS